MLVVSCPLFVAETFKICKENEAVMEKAAFENLRIYILAEKLADYVWEIVSKWDWLAKSTIGKQWVDSSDSIGANIAEGTGRGSYADNKRFAKIARGSLFEVRHWVRRADKRGLLDETEILKIREIITELTPKLSAYINSIGRGKTGVS